MATDSLEVLAEFEEEEKPAPALYDHCVRVYDTMLAQAAPEVVEDISDTAVPVYEGYLTKLMSGLGLSTPYYTSIRRTLMDMGCIEQIRRGGGPSPSRWALLQTPEEQVFADYEARKRGPKGRVAQVEQYARSLHKRMTEMEEAYDRLVISHESLASRVADLERMGR